MRLRRIQLLIVCAGVPVPLFTAAIPPCFCISSLTVMGASYPIFGATQAKLPFLSVSGWQLCASGNKSLLRHDLIGEANIIHALIPEFVVPFACRRPPIVCMLPSDSDCLASTAGRSINRHPDAVTMGSLRIRRKRLGDASWIFTMCPVTFLGVCAVRVKLRDMTAARAIWPITNVNFLRHCSFL